MADQNGTDIAADVDRYPTNTDAACYQAASFDAHSFVHLGQGIVQLRVIQEIAGKPGGQLRHGGPVDRVVEIPEVVYEEDGDTGTLVEVVACTACGMKLLTLPPERMRQLATDGAFAQTPCIDCGKIGCTTALTRPDPLARLGVGPDTGGHL